MSQWQAFLVSISIEAVVAYIFSYIINKEKKSRHFRCALTAIFSTAVTHPFAWCFNAYIFITIPFVYRAFIIETFVIITESFTYRLVTDLGWWRSLLLSIVANVFSFGLGLVIYAL